jgi:hypothetical protein
MEKGKGEDNARPPECRRAALLAGLYWSGRSGWCVIGGIHVRIAIDYCCHCLIPGEGGRRRHARHQRLVCVCESSCASSAQGQLWPL